MSLPTSIRADLPSWVIDEVDAAGPCATVDERMRLVNRLAARNFMEGSGGPFAALVWDADAGRIVSAGVNLVLSSQLSSMHAEVVTLSLAQTALGNWDLSSAHHELVVNWRPCAMCYGATIWSGISSLVIAGSGPELEEITGFDEGPIRDDWKQQAEDRGIRVTDGVLTGEALDVFHSYAASNRLVYNPRRAVSSQ